MLGDEKSITTALSCPKSVCPYFSFLVKTSFITVSANWDLFTKKFTYPPSGITFDIAPLASIFSAKSAAIIFGAFLNTFANLKHGNAKSPISLFGGTSINATISSNVKSSIFSLRQLAIAILKSCIMFSSPIVIRSYLLLYVKSNSTFFQVFQTYIYSRYKLYIIFI